MAQELSKGEKRERLPFNLLSNDEVSALNGISYESLPPTFSFSEITLGGAKEVWSRYQSYEPKHESRAHARLDEFLAKHAGQTEQDKLFVAMRQPYMQVVYKDKEFGMQFYVDGGEVVQGMIVPGGARRLILRNNLDSIQDEKSIIQIHNHPDDMTQSVSDVIGIVADEQYVPARCLYLVTTPNRYHLMFPTLETQRYPTGNIRDDIKRQFSGVYGTESTPLSGDFGGQSELMREIAHAYKLGYYVGDKSSVIPRVR